MIFKRIMSWSGVVLAWRTGSRCSASRHSSFDPRHNAKTNKRGGWNKGLCRDSLVMMTTQINRDYPFAVSLEAIQARSALPFTIACPPGVQTPADFGARLPFSFA